MAISDYITCCKCDVKLIYDGGKDNNRQWWEERWGKEPEIMCPDCEKKLEPVAWKDRTYGNLHHQDFGNSIPLYTTPPQRKPLTEEQIQAIWVKTLESGSSPNAFARAIEAAHGIREEA